MSTKKKVPIRARPTTYTMPRLPTPPPELRLRQSPDERERAVLDLFAKIEDEEGKDARVLAARAAALWTESFVRKLAHDLKNAVGSVNSPLYRMLAELAKPTPDLAALRGHAAQGKAGAEHLYRLIRRTHDVVMMAAPHYCEEPLAPMVEAARVGACAALGERATRLAFTSDVSDGLALHAEHAALVEALVELVKNAAEAYDAKAARLEVSVAARARNGGREVEIVVADRAHGIDSESLEWSFVPFGTAKPGGTGLGLPLARKLIEDVHKGTLEIQSAPGEGTRVRILMPRRQKGVQRTRRLTIDEMVELGARGLLRNG